MKKRTIRMIVTFIAIVITGLTAFYIGEYHGLNYDPSVTYEAPVRVEEIDEATGWVTLVDWDGEAWCIRGQDYEVGQLAIVTFNDNNTPDNIYDDLIVEVRCLVDIKDINE